MVSKNRHYFIFKVVILSILAIAVVGLAVYALILWQLKSSRLPISYLNQGKPQQTREKQISANKHQSSILSPQNRMMPAGQDKQKDRRAISNNSDTSKEKLIIIKKGEVRWEKLKILGDLGLTDPKMYRGCVYYSDYSQKNYPGVLERDVCPASLESGYSRGVRYVKVGKVVKGPYQGYDVLVIKTGYIEGLGDDELVMALLKNNQIIFLNPEKSKYLNNILQQYFQKGNYHRQISHSIVFEELTLPEVIKDPGTGAKFSKNHYDIAFFDATSLKPAFQHPIYDQVWMTDPVNPSDSRLELNSYVEYDWEQKRFVKKYKDIFKKNGFYIKLPNGLAASYKLLLDNITRDYDGERFGVLNVIWEDDTMNEDRYELNPSACGDGSYVYNETGRVNIKRDLKPIGEINLDPTGLNGVTNPIIYGYAHTKAPGFDELYNDIYYAKGKKKSKEKFLKIRPKVFYVDPYGRLLAFYRADILSPAECGKPVIYLYPTRPTEVQIQVKPNRGLTITEPQYKPGQGWQVLAQPDGQLIVDEQTYPYLFWEGSSDINYQQPTYLGWVVSRSELSEFFDDKLRRLGLIEKEITDFKEFWIPEMTKNNKPYYFITFLSKRLIDRLAPLTIKPQPDTVIRVMMDYRELDQPEKATGLPLSAPSRRGFTVVEWGGMLKR